MGSVAKRRIGPARTGPVARRPGRPAAPAPQPIRSPFDFGRPGGFDAFTLPFLPPLVVLPIVGAVLHSMAYGTPAMVWVPMLITALAVGLSWLAYHQSVARRVLLRVHVAITVGTAIESLAIHMLIGPFGNAVWPWIWTTVGCAWSISWLVPRLDAVRGDGKDRHEQETKSGLDVILGVPGAKARRVSHTDHREGYEITLPHGTTASVLKDVGPTIDAARKLPPGSTTVVPSRNDASKVEVHVQTVNVLAKPVPYPGPSAPGASIAEPLVIGMYENGQQVTYDIVGSNDPESLVSAPAVGVTVGMPGSGKTNGAMVEAAEVLSRKDVLVWWADPIKGAQSVAPILPLIDWFVSTVNSAHQMLAALDRLIPIRADYLGHKGLELWEPDCGLQFIWVHLEEASRILPDSEDFTRLSQAVRSVGIYLSASMQRASASMFDTDARHNLGLTRCYGTGDEVSAGMVLPETVLDAGVRPDAWRNMHPGRFVMTAPSIPMERWPVVARSYRITREQLARTVADGLALRGELTPAEIDAAGPLYIKRRRHGDGRQTVASLATDTTDEDDDMDYLLPVVPPELAEDLHLMNPRAEIDTTGVSLDLSDMLTPGPEMTAAQRDEAFIRIIASLSGEVTTAEIVDKWLDIPGMTLAQRPALARRITAMCERGAAERISHGRYLLADDAVTILRMPMVTDSDDDEDDDEGDMPELSPDVQ